MKWTDVQRIAEELFDQHPEIDPKTIRFVDLHNLVVDLPDFDDDHQRGGEKVGGNSAGLDRRGQVILELTIVYRCLPCPVIAWERHY